MTAYSPRAVLPLALVAGSLVLTVAACGGTDGSAPPTTGSQGAGTTAAASPTSSAPSTSSTAGSATTSTAPSGAGTTGGADGACAVGSLRIRYADDPGGAGAGSVTGTLTFTNTGSAPCTLTGFPGVSYVGGGNGTQVGQAATRTDDAVKTRTVAPGKAVTAQLRRSQPRNYGAECRQTDVDGFRVFPPGSTESAFVAFETTGCKSTDAPLLQIGPVR